MSSRKVFTPPPHVSLLLLLVLIFGALPAPAARAAQVQRERRVTTPARTAQTPTPTPTPARSLPTPTPQRPTPTQTPTPAPTPAATPSATPAQTPAAGSPQTLEDLRARIREITSRPEFAASHLALKVASLDTGRVVYEENAEKWMQPASNMKLYTVAAALDRFGPDYRFVTSVYAPARPDANGTVRGDLVVYGRGDPTFATRFNGDATGDYYRAIDELALRVTGAGVKRVEGDLVGDESYFAGGPLAPGWEWDDLQWWYGAEVS
ncbi:MAG TPA: D-alanyl-D-alanine carboxypeptidase, partial [Pyrinomonadaceae bacterium]|nr:D-alanyl-D-alanine carboxypeptidase [Pyrinomonadaceae bacterium]